MSRLKFPDEGSRKVEDTVSGRGRSSTRVDIFTDVAGTTAATDLLDAALAANTTGYVTTDRYAMLPIFSGPDGVDTLYAQVPGGPVWPMYARVDDRLDAVALRLSALEGGAVSTSTALTAETAARAAADSAEASARAAADSAESALRVSGDAATAATAAAGTASEASTRAAADTAETSARTAADAAEIAARAAADAAESATRAANDSSEVTARASAVSAEQSARIAADAAHDAAIAANTAAITAATAAEIARANAAYQSKPATADATLWVGSAGSDANDGKSPGSAFATVQAAHDALPVTGGRVMLGAGTFTGVATVSKPNVTVEGVGPETVVQTPASGSTDLLAVNAAYFTARNLTLKPQGTWSGSLAKLTTAPDGCFENVIFDGSAATSIYGNSVHVTSGDRVTVRRCSFLQANGATNYGNTGVELRACANAEVSDNYFNGGRNYQVDARSLTSLCVGLKVVRNTHQGGATHAIITWNGHAYIAGNRVYSPGGYGIFVTGDPSAGQTNYGTHVINNYIKTPGQIGIGLEYDVHQFVISGNTIDTPTGNGISYIRQITDGVISNNTILSSTGTYGGISCAVFSGATSSYRVAVIGNVVRSATQKGIYLEDSADSLVLANVITGCAVGVAISPTYAPGTVYGTNFLTGNTADYSAFSGVTAFTSNGLASKVKAGTPSDADFAAAPPDGTIIGDSTGTKIWIRLGGAWKSVAVA
jgi:parallel beta-helix repeat protein